MPREQFPDTVGENEDGVIRFDLKFPVAVKDGKPREMWIDHVIVQETSRSCYGHS